MNAAAGAPAPSWTQSQAQPRVFITTLGTFEALVDNRLAHWVGGGAGRLQLRRSFACLIIYCERRVLRPTLENIAGGRPDGGQRRVFSGVLQMLRSWGMSAAVECSNGAMTLRRHPSWRMDTDELAQRAAQAQQAEIAGDMAAAVHLLQDMLDLCGGEYLAGVFAKDPVHTMTDQRTYWRITQRNALAALARCSLALSGRQHAEMAYAAAQRAREFDPESVELQLLLAAIAERLAKLD